MMGGMVSSLYVQDEVRVILMKRIELYEDYIKCEYMQERKSIQQ